jgi:hypothetical protein
VSDGISVEGFDFDAPYRPFAEPLGRLVFAFSYLEKDLNWCVTALAGIDPIGRSADAMLGKMPNFSTRIGKIGEGLRERGEACDQWAALESRLLLIGEFRNFAIHGLWSAFSTTVWQVGEPAWQVQKVDLKTKRLISRMISVTDLESAMKEALCLSVEILNYVQPIVGSRR